MSIINHLFSLTNFHKGAYCLDNMKLMVDKLDLKDFPKCIHVAGTNGKGSVCHKIANTLTHSGYKTGLFTSPHISTFRERVKIDHRLIPEAEAFTLIEKILNAFSEIQKEFTFFEVMTLLALLYFKKEKVDFAVIETGLGGRLDATNVINPVLSIITSISLDHTQILGDSIDKIGFEKAGIIKDNIPVVLGPKAKLSSILNRAKQKSSEVIQVEGEYLFYDEENSLIAKKVLGYLAKKYNLKYSNLEDGLKSRPACRFECVENVVYDVAHNPKGIDKLLQALQEKFPKNSFRFVIAFSKDKDHVSMVKKLKPFSKGFHLVSDEQRLLSVSELETLIKPLIDNYTYQENLEKTVLDAYKKATNNNEVLVVVGSFYIMDKVKTLLSN